MLLHVDFVLCGVSVLQKPGRFASMPGRFELWAESWAVLVLQHSSGKARNGQCPGQAKPLARAGGRLQSSPLNFHSVFSLSLFQQWLFTSQPVLCGTVTLHGG